MKTVFSVVLLAGLAAASPIQAQQAMPSAKPTLQVAESRQPVDLGRFKQALTNARRKMFEDAMSNLSAEQSQAFWAIYADYEKDKDALAAARINLTRKYIETYTSKLGLAEFDIAEIVEEMATLQKKQMNLRVKYFRIYNRQMDAQTAGHFALVDDYITTAVRLDLLDQIPFPGDAAAK